jgi:hypothetical protein
MNWRMQGDSSIRYFLHLADAYMSSAIILVKQCLICNSDKKSDVLIFPILANANHGIELYLKAMNWMLNEKLKSKSKLEGRHNLDQIYRMLKSKIKTSEGSVELKDFEKGMVELENYINELSTKIRATSKNDRMDFARYPISNSYENHFYVDGLKNIEVDLENFVKRFEVIKDKLGWAAEHLYDSPNEEH